MKRKIAKKLNSIAELAERRNLENTQKEINLKHKWGKEWRKIGDRCGPP